jgi:hypothetical protein
MVLPAIFQFNGTAIRTTLQVILHAAAPDFAPGSFTVLTATGTGARKERPACTAIQTAAGNQVAIGF